MFYLSWNQFVHRIFYRIPTSSTLKISRVLGELYVFSLLLAETTPLVLLGKYPVNDSIFLLHLLSHCSSSTLSHPHWWWEKLVLVVITAHSIWGKALINSFIIPSMSIKWHIKVQKGNPSLIILYFPIGLLKCQCNPMSPQDNPENFSQKLIFKTHHTFFSHLSNCNPYWDFVCFSLDCNYLLPTA